MAKYIDAEKLKAEIERHRQAIRVLSEHTAPEQTSKTCAIFQYSDTILSELLSFLNTLSEEPSESLEEAAEEKYPVYWKNYPKDGIVRSESAYDTNKQCRDAFIAGAEWQKEQMMKEAVEAMVTTNLANRPVIYLDQLEGFQHGDKVRIIIVKEESK